jgi:two-component system, response regulator YesN
MYELILVEDEVAVREAVVREIDWERHGFCVVEQAENGKEAMELIERRVLDLVVTDIRMPFMDGLQLAAWLRQKYPAVKIIILTGFDEFEYAQKAIKLHVDEYVLKPFSAEELVGTLLKIKKQMDEEAAEKENVETLTEHYRKSLPVLREVFLASLVSRRLKSSEIEEKCSSYHIDLVGSGYICSVVRMDTLPEAKNQQQGSLSLKDSSDKELKRFAVYNIAEEIVRRHPQDIAFIHKDQVVILSIEPTNDMTGLLKRALSAAEEIRYSVEKFLKYTVTVGIGTVKQAVTDVSYSYKDAELALDYSLILGGNRTIYIADVEERQIEEYRFDELQEQALVRCLKVGSDAEMMEIIEQLFEGIAETPVSFQSYQIYLMEILTTILKTAKESNLDLEGLFSADSAPLAQLYRFSQLSEARAWFVQLCRRIMSSIAAGRQSSYSFLVEKAKDYTRAHFHESDISIGRVCSHLHISTGYFSSIFKKETKTTYVNYLLHIRMEAAKELLLNTDLRTFEIAEKVGYTDPNYFSFSFRKYCGVSPKDYRGGLNKGG